jgi:hypothetical protein
MDPVSVITDQKVKANGYSYPDNRPAHCLFEGQRMIFLLKKSKVNAEHEGDEQEK